MNEITTPPAATFPPAFEEGPTPSVAAILFEIREQQRIGTGYKFRYSQTDDTMERATFVRKWKDVQQSKYYLKAACQVVWMREEQERIQRRREEERRRREQKEAIRRRELEERRERQREEERRRELLRIKKDDFHEQQVAPWWVRAAMVQIPPALPSSEEPIEVPMEEAAIYDDYHDTFTEEYNDNLFHSYENYDNFDNFDNYNSYSLSYSLNPSHPHHRLPTTTTTTTTTTPPPTTPPTTPTPTTSVMIPSSDNGWKNGAGLCFV